MRIKNKELKIKNAVITASANQTINFGKKLARQLKGGEIIALTGNLGAGKTTLLKGLAKGLGVKIPITSPTFVLMKVYKITKHKTIEQLVHVDCYRLPGTEFTKIGLQDYLADPHTVVAIEWASKLKLKSKNLLCLSLKLGKKLNERVITIAILCKMSQHRPDGGENKA